MSEEVIAELRRQLAEKDATISTKDQELGALRTQLAEIEPLRTSTKLRHILEVLEKVGRPSGTSQQEWQFNVSHAGKWETFGINKGRNHPWVDQFLSCVETCCTTSTSTEKERQEIIKIVFDICDGKIHAFFQAAKVDLSIFKSARIKCAVKCLEDLELEVLNFYARDKQE